MAVLVEELRQLLVLIYRQFTIIFPYWAAGLLAGSVISVFLSDKITEIVKRTRSNRSPAWGVLTASVLGAASPLCMYGTVPLIAAMGRKGVPQSFLASFMVTSILINPSLFIYSFALGAPLALLRLLFSILAGGVAGILVHCLYKNKPFFNFQGFAERECRVKPHTWRGLLRDMHQAVIITAPYFFVGILLAALFERYVPKMWMVNLFGANRELGVLLAVSLGVPIYVCGGGTIPLLRGWLNMGMSPGAVIAFALSGASTKLTNLSAVKIILGIQGFVVYILFNILFAVLAGWLVDWTYILF